MSFNFYKVLHICSLAVVLLSLGGASFSTYLAGQKPASLKKIFGMVHGIGMLILVIAGFGMLTKLGIFWPLPGWVTVKIAVWIVLGGWIAVVYKLAPKHPVVAGFLPVLLVAVSASAALFK